MKLSPYPRAISFLSSAPRVCRMLVLTALGSFAATSALALSDLYAAIENRPCIHPNGKIELAIEYTNQASNDDQFTVHFLVHELKPNGYYGAEVHSSSSYVRVPHISQVRVRQDIGIQAQYASSPARFMVDIKTDGTNVGQAIVKRCTVFKKAPATLSQ